MKRILPIAISAALGISALLGSQSLLAAAPNAAGMTLSVKGEVTAANADSGIRDLRRGSEVYESDEVVTGAESTARFKMKDGAIFSLDADTHLVVAEYRHEQSGDSEDSAAMELVEGTFRFVSGAIGKERHEDWSLKAGSTSIGIRGTEGIVSKSEREVIITIIKGRIAAFSPDCPETLIGKGTKYNTIKFDENGCSPSYVPTPFSQLTPEAFEVVPLNVDNNTEEGGGGGGTGIGGGEETLGSPN